MGRLRNIFHCLFPRPKKLWVINFSAQQLKGVLLVKKLRGGFTCQLEKAVTLASDFHLEMAAPKELQALFATLLPSLLQSELTSAVLVLDSAMIQVLTLTLETSMLCQDPVGQMQKIAVELEPKLGLMADEFCFDYAVTKATSHEVTYQVYVSHKASLLSCAQVLRDQGLCVAAIGHTDCDYGQGWQPKLKPLNLTSKKANGLSGYQVWAAGQQSGCCLNLLPWREAWVLRRRRRFLMQLTCLAAAVLGLSVSYGYWQKDMLAEAQIELAALKRIGATVDQRLLALQKSKSQLNALQKRIETFASLTEGRGRIVSLLNWLPEAMPKGLVLTRLAIGPSQIAFSGQSAANKDVSQFLRAIGEYPQLKAGNLEVIQKPIAERKKGVSHFVLTTAWQTMPAANAVEGGGA